MRFYLQDINIEIRFKMFTLNMLRLSISAWSMAIKIFLLFIKKIKYGSIVKIKKIDKSSLFSENKSQE